MTTEPTSSEPLPPNSPRSTWLHALRRVRASQLVWAVCVLVLLLVAADQTQRALSFRVDDAYITFSFSKNLGTGHGPVFSHGLRVEGYSNFLWMVVIAIRYLFRADGDPLDFARIVAFGCLTYAIITAYRMARRAANPAAGLVAAGLLVACSDLFRAAASGLETVPFATAILVGWDVYLRESPSARRWSLVAFLPAALMRIDGFVPLLIAFGVECLAALGARRFNLLRLARWALPAFAVWGAYFLWRYSYYGLLLPTTYYAKTVVAQGDPDRGVRQAFDVVRDYGALALFPLASLALAGRYRRDATCLALAVALQVGYAMTVGGDWMPFNRFFLPIVPLSAVLVAWGTEYVWGVSSKYAWSQRWSARLVTFAALAFSCLHLHVASIDSPQEQDKLGNATHNGNHVRNNLLANKDLMAYVVRRPGDKLVTDYAGVFSVFTDAEVIDVWGLCNADIALHGGTNGINPIYGKECAQCYARLKPDYFHVGIPIVRSADSFHNLGEVLDNVFQGYAIDHVIGIRRHFGVGRVIQESTGRTLWFLERRRPGLPLEPRRPAPDIRVDYPFEAGRAASNKP